MKRYTDEMKTAVIARLKAGETAAVIGADLKVSPKIISAWKKKAETVKPIKATNGNQKYPPKVRAKALALLAKGKRASDIATQLKINPAIVGYWKTAAAKQDGAVAVNGKGNGEANGHDKKPAISKTDIRDALVFFGTALKFAKQRSKDPMDDPVALNLAYGINVLKHKA